MSIPLKPKIEAKVVTLLIRLLKDEELNVTIAEQELGCCEKVVEQHQKRVHQLKSALEALRVDASEIEAQASKLNE